MKLLIFYLITMFALIILTGVTTAPCWDVLKDAGMLQLILTIDGLTDYGTE